MRLLPSTLYTHIHPFASLQSTTGHLTSTRTLMSSASQSRLLPYRLSSGAKTSFTLPTVFRTDVDRCEGHSKRAPISLYLSGGQHLARNARLHTIHRTLSLATPDTTTQRTLAIPENDSLSRRQPSKTTKLNDRGRYLPQGHHFPSPPARIPRRTYPSSDDDPLRGGMPCLERAPPQWVNQS